MAEALAATYPDREPTPAQVREVLNAEHTRLDREAELERRQAPWHHAAAMNRQPRKEWPTLHPRTLLDFERQFPGAIVGGKVRAIRNVFDMPAHIYAQQLHRTIEGDFAVEYAPDVVAEVRVRLEAYAARRMGAAS